MKILVLDNYDSFTYNLVHYVEKILNKKADVYRNDEIGLEEVKKYDKIILSPGPGIPDEANLLKPIIKEYGPDKSILGVCLGVQAIAEVYGGSLINLESVYHGVATTMEQVEPDEKLFRNIPRNFEAGRYHSWIVDKKTLPPCFKISSVDGNGQIMSIFHTSHDVRGVQFHPESVLTPFGEKMIRNWLES
ncbi:MAG: aminodeoxychorismate/anthranilate synthase component II [Bacteroidales bacterium]